MMFFIYILIAVNVLAFVQMAIDKRLAEKKKWRISEMQLALPVVFGGLVGALLGMLAFRHKTKKRSFQLKLLLAIILCGGIIYALCTGSPER